MGLLLFFSKLGEFVPYNSITLAGNKTYLFNPKLGEFGPPIIHLAAYMMKNPITLQVCELCS